MSRPAVVALSHLRWDFVFQRPQHLLSRCAQDARTFFVEEPEFRGTEATMETRQPLAGLTVVVPVLPEGSTSDEQLISGLVERFLDEQAVDRYVLWYYTPMAVALTRRLRPVATVYDCMDELSGFADAPREVRDREGELVDSVDLVFTGGRSLFEAKRRLHGNVHLFPSSVDAGHFLPARGTLSEPPDQAGLPRPRIGYYGVIDERLDLDLLDELARLRPERTFVMVGPVVKIDPSSLPRRPNISYLGAKRYDELPAYLASWDVAIMPFARNDATRYISPTKTLEYLAGGRPVVSTSIRDVVDPYEALGLVRIADDPQVFAAAIEDAMTEDAAERLQRADDVLAQRSWDRTWAEMRALIDDAVAVNEHRRSEPLTSRRCSTNGRHPADDGTVANGAKPTTLRVIEDHSPTDGFDHMIVGAGFAGSVLAERLANDAGKRVVVVDKRSHIAGNAYDHHDEHGILVHRYGPHIFHTNCRDVFGYLSRFTSWRPYQHRVLASVDGRLVPIPINLDTLNTLYGMNLTTLEAAAFLEGLAEPIGHAITSEDVVVGKVGRELYEKFFRGYTRKQWGMDPSELDASVTARVPVRTNRDDRYFTDTYQAMPLQGYTRMFERMLDHPNIKIMLNTDYREVRNLLPHDQLIYTGPIDEYFDHRFGKLPYRSLDFRFETHDRAVHQPAPVVNYPNDYDYTRVTEFKYLTGQEHPKTTLVYEYPRADGDPYYPVPQPENAALYKRYKALAQTTENVTFVGRLGTYKYYNMDQVVAQALATYGRLIGRAPATETADGAIISAPAAVGGRGVHVQQGQRRTN